MITPYMINAGDAALYVSERVFNALAPLGTVEQVHDNPEDLLWTLDLDPADFTLFYRET